MSDRLYLLSYFASNEVENWVKNDPTLLLAEVKQNLEQWALDWFEQERLTLLALVEWSLEVQAWADLQSMVCGTCHSLHLCHHLCDLKIAQQ